MVIEKELSSISLPITEPEYRARPELSYSTLSRYESLGFDGLDHLFDKLDTPSLLLGSCVDTLLTGSMEEFNEHFRVIDVNITESGAVICKKLADLYRDEDIPFADIPEATVSQVAKETGFWQADKWDKIRYREVLKTGNVAEYFMLLKNNTKRLVSTEMYNEALACVMALRTAPSTSGLFAPNNPEMPIQRYYQLKFASEAGGVGYRIMMDLVLVDYENKIIYPYDLKTCGIPEWNFASNFLKYHYYIQSRLYARVLRDNCSKDDYFKDFKIENFRFIVINKKTLTPLVWEFPLTWSYGTLVDTEGVKHKDPYALGEELHSYLVSRPAVPKGIDVVGVNMLDCLCEETKV